MTRTFSRVVSVIKETITGCPDIEMTKNTNLAEDLSADSLDIVELLMAIEEEFGIHISDKDGEQIKTIGDIVRIVDMRS